MKANRNLSLRLAVLFLGSFVIGSTTSPGVSRYLGQKNDEPKEIDQEPVGKPTVVKLANGGYKEIEKNSKGEICRETEYNGLGIKLMVKIIQSRYPNNQEGYVMINTYEFVKGVNGLVVPRTKKFESIKYDKKGAPTKTQTFANYDESGTPQTKTLTENGETKTYKWSYNPEKWVLSEPGETGDVDAPKPKEENPKAEDPKKDQKNDEPKDLDHTPAGKLTVVKLANGGYKEIEKNKAGQILHETEYNGLGIKVTSKYVFSLYPNGKEGEVEIYTYGFVQGVAGAPKKLETIKYDKKGVPTITKTETFADYDEQGDPHTKTVTENGGTKTYKYSDEKDNWVLSEPGEPGDANAPKPKEENPKAEDPKKDTKSTTPTPKDSKPRLGSTPSNRTTPATKPRIATGLSRKIDSCLVGTWRSVSAKLHDMTSGGSGILLTIKADGTTTIDYDGMADMKAGSTGTTSISGKASGRISTNDEKITVESIESSTLNQTQTLPSGTNDTRTTKTQPKTLGWVFLGSGKAPYTLDYTCDEASLTIRAGSAGLELSIFVFKKEK